MKKRIWLLLLIVFASILLTGCALQTVDEMYALPKRSKEYDSLQSAIDSAMYGLSYSAPVSGENQQTVQMADLDGDGVEEYIVFAQGNSANPLQVLIFRQEEDGTCRLMEVIQSNGSAFEQVEYVQMDNAPGYELVVGRQLSDQVLRSVSVYSFSSGSAEQLMMVGYSKFITCDLNDDGCSELMVILPGESETGTGSAVLYRMQDAGYISGRDVTVTTQNGRKRSRVLYHLEPSGRERLTELKAEFDRVQQGIQSVFQNSVPIGYRRENGDE